MSYHTTYRPASFDDIVGHERIIASLKQALSAGSRAFLLTGPTGVGKTTIARIIASENDAELIEIDGATNTGVDKMRAVTDNARHRSLMSQNKCVIVDECHQLSKQTWQSLLKILEEPPEHLIWVLCTTESNKVPDTIKSRCVDYSLPYLMRDEIERVLAPIIDKESLAIADDVYQLIVSSSQGSARRALTILEKVHACATVEEARALIVRDVPTPEAYDLAKALIGGEREAADAILVKMKDAEAEGTRIVLMAYAHSTYLNGNGAKKNRALHLMSMMEHPCDTLTKHAPITLRVARFWHKVSS